MVCLCVALSVLLRGPEGLEEVGGRRGGQESWEALTQHCWETKPESQPLGTGQDCFYSSEELVQQISSLPDHCPVPPSSLNLVPCRGESRLRVYLSWQPCPRFSCIQERPHVLVLSRRPQWESARGEEMFFLEKHLLS